MTSTYLMEDPREAARLAAKVDPAAWVDRYLAADLPTAHRILDVGCGPGVIAAEIHQRAGHAEVVGVDGSPARIEEARKRERTNLSFRVADAGSLPFPDDYFDLAYCRFMLEYVPDPLKIVREMKRVSRPGATILLQDLDGQLVWHYPFPDELRLTLDKVLAAMAETGFDPFVGRKLFTIAHGAGLGNLTVQAEPYHLYAGRIDDANLRHWELKLEIARPIAERVLGIKDAHTLLSAFLDLLQREDALTYSVQFTLRGVVSD